MSKKRKIISIMVVGSALVVGSTVFSGTAMAQGLKNINRSPKAGIHQPLVRPVAMGIVTSISGNTISLTSHKGFGSTTPDLVYTVDATNATITKMVPGASGVKPTSTVITVADIAVGDRLTVEGTISGINVVATKIKDLPAGNFQKGKNEKESTNEIKPVANGKVTAVSGNFITIVGSKNKTTYTYTVDATSATITKITAGGKGVKPNSAVITVSSIAVGDNLVVSGTMSGTSITATKIMDRVFTMTGRKGGLGKTK